MHFEILVEDQSGKKALETFVPQIIGDSHTYTIHCYKGIGRIPKNLSQQGNPQKRILLDQPPRLLNGYGKTFSGYPKHYPAAAILICDLDDNCLNEFKNQLYSILDNCAYKPETRFCIAIEEGEAWFLGDLKAIRMAYPKAKTTILEKYENDSICGTWELLADAIYPGGSSKLSSKGWQAVGKEKFTWAERISPLMDMNNNTSPSFIYFREKLKELTEPS